jgi:hypothetical protein
LARGRCWMGWARRFVGWAGIGSKGLSRDEEKGLDAGISKADE